MNKRRILLIALGVGLAGISMSAFVFTRDRGDSNSQVLSLSQYHNDEYGLRLSHPSNLEITSISEEDKQAKIFLRLQQREAPEYLITARAETGLRLPSQLARLSTMDLVIDGALKSLPSRYEEFAVESQDGVVEVNNDAEAREIVFSYNGPSGARAKQRLILIVVDDDTAIYISMQSRETDYNELKSAVFDNILSSISF